MEINQLSGIKNTTPVFLQNATNSLENMEAYASLLIRSGLVPKHFYELDQYRNPIKDANGNFKGNTAAVIMTIQHGLELGMSITQSLQQIVPVNGLMSVKGDAAKALIMTSGLCAEWIEEEVGSGENFGYKITSSRKDGQKLTRTFTVEDAKRAGLWITEDMVAKEPKLKHSPWYKYQKRMLRYRCLGFMARDLYGDVLQNMYTEEEAAEIQLDNATKITHDGLTVSIDQSVSTGALLTQTAAAAVEPPKEQPPVRRRASAKKTEEQPPVIPVEEAPALAQPETLPAGDTAKKEELKTVEEVRAMGNTELLQYVGSVVGADKIEELFIAEPEKRTKRVLVEIYSAYSMGQLDVYIQNNFDSKLPVPTESFPAPLGEPGKDHNFPPLGPSGERGLRDALTACDMLEKQGIDSDAVLAFISEQGLNYKSAEDFYKKAPVELLNHLMNG